MRLSVCYQTSHKKRTLQEKENIAAIKKRNTLQIFGGIATFHSIGDMIRICTE